MSKGSVSCRLNILLAERRLTVADLHKATGLSRTLLYLMQRDDLQRVDLQSLATLCDFLDCEVSDLLFYEKKSTKTDA